MNSDSDSDNKDKSHNDSFQDSDSSFSNRDYDECDEMEDLEQSEPQGIRIISQNKFDCNLDTESIRSPSFLEQPDSTEDKSILDIITNSPKPVSKIKQYVHNEHSIFSSKKDEKHKNIITRKKKNKYELSIPIFIAKNNQVQILNLHQITRLKIWQLQEFQMIEDNSKKENPNESLESIDFLENDFSPTLALNTAIPLEEFIQNQLSRFSIITPLNFISLQEYKQQESLWNSLIVYEVRNANMFAEMAVRYGAALNVRIQEQQGKIQFFFSTKFPNIDLCKCPKMKKIVNELVYNPFGNQIEGVLIDAKYIDTSKCCFNPPKKSKSISDENITSSTFTQANEPSPSTTENVSCTFVPKAVLVFPQIFLKTNIRDRSKIEEDDILKIICGFARGEVLIIEDAQFIVNNIKDIFIHSPNVIDIKIDDRGLVVVGDLHGNLQDMLYIFQEKGLPSSVQPYLFLGDFVDRGENCPEVILLAFALKLCYPDSVYILRGNHESHSVNLLFEKYNQGWMREFAAKYNVSLLENIEEAFNHIPIMAIGNQRLAFVHGGIGAVNSINTIKTLHRHTDVQTGGILSAILWSDPVEEPNGFSKSSRGVGIFNYGPDITEGFLRRNQLTHLIRSHTVIESGYRLNHNGKVITVFSCSSYNSNPNQRGSILHINSDLEMIIWRFHSEYNISDIIPIR